jgi:hypothetical protein
MMAAILRFVRRLRDIIQYVGRDPYNVEVNKREAERLYKESSK